MPVHAPYNFIPLSKKVFFPEWAEQVSQDIPFSDGISGEVACTLTAISPIYVRNGGDWKDVKVEPEAQSFFKVGNEYIIPGTSLKGMLRNVIEIISFGKMGRVDNGKYSFRDLSKGHPYLKMVRGAQAGWLIQNKADRTWQLTRCEFARVDHNDLIKLNPNARGIKQEQIAKGKYEKWTKSLDVIFDPNKTKTGTRAANLGINSARTKGTIVFTGQPSENDGRKGKKHLEFIFYAPSATNGTVPPDKIREFEEIHADSLDLKFHKDRGVIPVFFHGTQTNPDSIGLAMMYRMPYKNTIHEAISHTSADHFHSDMDLSETIFGLEGKPEGLKGRVWVTQATAETATARPGTLIKTILNSPKPSYFPSYLEQPSLPSSYKTLMDSDCKVRGWKRYPARPFQQNQIPVPDAEQANVSTKFIPLHQGVQFTFKIKVHNLKPAELGALLWALEWGGDKSLCHSLGMGKAYGFGQVRICVTEGTTLSGVTGVKMQQTECVKQFEACMNAEVGGDWRQTLQIQQLLGMVNPALATGKMLIHMKLEPNQFVIAKNRMEGLNPYVSINGILKDDERFRILRQRPQRKLQMNNSSLSTIANSAIKASISAPPATERWENVQLTYEAGKAEFGIAGKKAMAKRTSEIPLVADEVIFKIKKRGFVKANVNVEGCGGGAYRIIKVEPV